MPELSFKGKEFVFNHRLAVPHRPLVPDASKSLEEPRLDGNLVIHDENLHAAQPSNATLYSSLNGQQDL